MLTEQKLKTVDRAPQVVDVSDRKRQHESRRRSVRVFVVSLALLALSVIALTVTYRLAYAERVYPGVFDAQGLRLGALTRQDLAAVLAERYRPVVERPLRLRHEDREWLVTAEALGAGLEFDRVLKAAFGVGRQGSLAQQVADQLDALRSGRIVGEQAIQVGEVQVAGYAATLQKAINRPAANARLVIDSDLDVTIAPSQTGRQLDTQKTINLLFQASAGKSTDVVDLPVAETLPAVVDSDLQPARTAVAKMLSAPLTLQFETRTWTLSRVDIAKLLVLQGGAMGTPGEVAKLDEDGIARFVSKLATEIDQEPRTQRLKSDGGPLRVIREGRPGYTLDTLTAAKAVQAAVLTDNRMVQLPVKVAYPAGQSENRQAIKELVSSATTNYAGGLPERRHNVELAASKLDGVVVGPGEIFSFNEELGPMTLQAGFKWGWGVAQSLGGQVITVPSVAGGICQVSTTLFQALFWAGYQIEERNWHLYWIDRYGQPPSGLKGLDATVDQVYDRNGKLVNAIDLKFKNTTPYPILLEAKTDGSSLTFNVYSTKPKWQVIVDPPRIEAVVRSDPAVVRELDPTLAPGEEVWIEAAQDGFKSTIVRTVIEQGKEPRVLRVASTYKPSRNVVRVGQAPPAGEVTNESSAAPNSVVVGGPSGDAWAAP